MNGTGARPAGVVLRVWAWLHAAAFLVLAVAAAAAAIVLLMALLGGLVLVPVFGLGVPVVAGALGATRVLADGARRVAGGVLGTELTAQYNGEPGWSWRALVASLRDQQTARDAVWLGAHAVAGTIAVLVVYVLVAASGASSPVAAARSRS